MCVGESKRTTTGFDLAQGSHQVVLDLAIVLNDQRDDHKQIARSTALRTRAEEATSTKGRHP